jgi:cytochrome b6-f complex iron-sulfur subunit
MNRRQFLTWVGIGGIASYLPVAIAACSSDSPNTTSTTSEPTEEEIDTTPRPDGFFAVSTIAQLDEDGQIGKKEVDVIVIRDPETSELIALKSRCTHQGCTVKWDLDNNKFACPCHGSAYNKKGEVVSGPAEKPLEIYEVKEEEGLVLVKTT